MAGIGTTPGSAVLAEDVRDFQPGTSHRCRRLSRRLLPLGLAGLGLLRFVRLADELVDRARHSGDDAGRHVGVMRRRLEPMMSKQAWISLISVPRSSRWVAKLCRSVCSVTRLRMPAALAASWNSRPSCRVVIGRPGTRPGKSQRSCGAMPASWFVGRSTHHCRDSARTQGGSITCRSLRPLDCTMRMMFCALSMSPARSLITSPARRPQP
jgi:hypothetical protein